jgi:DNA-binding GntR family transcriptional regulator
MSCSDLERKRAIDGSRHDWTMSHSAQRESAADRVHRWVRSRILDGTFAGGRLLSEGEVADALELSRTPVREAFLQLATEGMLELYPKRGALVLTVSAAELREVLVACALIEPWAARVVAGRPDRDGVTAVLRRQTEKARRGFATRDRPGPQEADRRFHEQLVAAAGNELIAAFYRSLRDRQLRAGILATYNDPARAEASMVQHDAIVEALDRGDADGAAAMILAHLNGTATALGLAPLNDEVRLTSPS